VHQDPGIQDLIDAPNLDICFFHIFARDETICHVCELDIKLLGIQHAVLTNRAEPELYWLQWPPVAVASVTYPDWITSYIVPRDSPVWGLLL